MLYLISMVLAAYVIWRGVLPLPLTWEAKLISGLCIVAASQIYLVYQYFGGTVFAPELPRKVIIFCGFLYATLVFGVLLIVTKDILFVLLKAAAACHWYQQAIEVYTIKIAVTFLVVAMLLAAYSVRAATTVPAVRTTEIVIDRLPAALDGLKVVVLADLHSSAMIQRPTVSAVVEQVNALQPDLILLPGDMIDGQVVARTADVAPLQDLQAVYGVYGCVGNHEYYSGLQAWRDRFSELGIKVLYNQNQQILINDKLITLVGVTDYAAQQFQAEEPDIEQAIHDMKPDALCILMAHQPKGAWENYQHGVDLQISGHTHGGMILGIRALLEPFNNGFISGVYDVGAMKLYVSNGTGIWNGFPVRLGVPAEITQLILRAKPQ